jgi:glutamyl-tRNA reductase
MSMSTPISSASFAYPWVDGASRATLAEALQRQSLEIGSATFVLNTCLRTEVFVAGDENRLHHTLDSLFGGEAVVGIAKVRHDVDAVDHLYRIAAGLESPIRGEGEILTQFRHAVSRSAEAGAISGIFAKLLETAVAVGRQARELLPDSPHDSMAAVAAQVVGGADRVAVLGSGTMATAVVRGLQGLPAPPSITVVARTPERVALPAVDVWPFERAVEALEDFPAIVSATSAKKRLVGADAMAGVVSSRATALTLVDMAMPPDFAVRPSATIRYVDIDGLARMAERRPRSEEADALVHQAAIEAHRAYVDHHQVGPVIGELTRQADEIVEAAIARFGGRLTTREDLAVLRQTAHTVARTLLAGPISYIKQTDRAPEAVDVVADAFGVDE